MKREQHFHMINLLYNGLKQGTVNFILNNNKELYEYVLSVIEKKGFYEYKADEESNNYMGIKNIILYGVAGVGKTHNINKLIKLIEDRNSEKRYFQLFRIINIVKI